LVAAGVKGKGMYLACIIIFHVKDYLKRADCKGNETATRKAVRTEFEVVRSVCNGSKHLVIDGSHPIRFAPGDDWYRPQPEPVTWLPACQFLEVLLVGVKLLRILEDTTSIGAQGVAWLHLRNWAQNN
jgi:hypothetical protein